MTKNWILLGLLILVTIPGYLLYLQTQQLAPLNTSLSLTFSYPGDYYQLLHYIFSGMHGKLLYTLPYIEHVVPPMVFVPIYFLAGLVLGPLVHSQIAIMLILRILCTLFYFICFLWLIKLLFPSFIFRLIAVILMISYTPFWTKTFDASGPLFRYPIEGRDVFSVFYKFHLPPHHYIAIAAIMMCIGLLSKKIWTKKNIILIAVSTATVGLQYTYHVSLLAVIATINGLWETAKTGNWKRGVLITLPVIIPTGLIYAYYATTSAFQLPGSTLNVRTLFIPLINGNELKQFALAFGPLGMLSLLFLIPLVMRKSNRLLNLLLLWAILPFVEIIFPHTLSFLRPYSLHQYIPLSLLATAGFSYLVSKKKILIVFLPMILAATILYAIPPYIAAFQRTPALDPKIDFQTFIPNDLLKAFTYLDNQTSIDSYILAGQYASIMIPAFSQNRVIVGQGDSMGNYLGRINAVQLAFYRYSLGTADDANELKQFLERFNISYVLFGVDSPSYRGDEPTYPFLQEVFRSGDISVVKFNK